MRGSFKHDPQRAREDAPGAAPFGQEPPQHLPQECTRAWRYLVERLPKVALYSTDEVAVEMAARLLAQFWMSGSLDVLKELRQWLAKLGFSPVDRTRLTAEAGAKKNKFTDPE